MPTIEAAETTLGNILSGLLNGYHSLNRDNVKEHIKMLKSRSVNKQRAIEIAEEEARNNSSEYFSDIVREELEYSQNGDLYEWEASDAAELELIEAFHTEALEVAPGWGFSYDLIPGWLIEQWVRDYCPRQGYIAYSPPMFLKIDWTATAEHFTRTLSLYEIQGLTFYAY